MIPAALSRELQLGLEDFLRASFWSNTPGFAEMMDRFLAQHGELVRGPFVSVKLPFRQGQVSASGGTHFFAEVPMKWPPHAHQLKAFERLSQGASTLIATGTGSGKTESFLVPILAHCARNLGKRGIKAILIYPMNALATDQARRVAQLVSEHLGGKVTAGLFVGQQESAPRTGMGADFVITDRKVLVDCPPDILMTNYKMLDYLLLRPEHQRLWRDNGPDTLKFLVVDEVHTFDGAQGTDLACLIRRLKARLGMTNDQDLCCVGTSATLGSDQGSESLIRYASELFGTPFGPDCVVTESRMTAEEFRGPLTYLVPPELTGAAQELLPDSYVGEAEYLVGQAELWFGMIRGANEGEGAWQVRLGEALRQHAFLLQVLDMLCGGPMELEVLSSGLRTRMKTFRELSVAQVRALVLSFVSLLGHARAYVSETAEQAAQREACGGERVTLPLVQVQVQLWQREMGRMVTTVGQAPELRFGDSVDHEDHAMHLPAVYCSRCGLMGWASLVSEDKRRDLRVDLNYFYTGFFGQDGRVVFLFPDASLPGFLWSIDPQTLQRTPSLRGEPLPQGHVLVVETENTVATKNGYHRLTKTCPRCQAHESLTLIGYRAATLLSMAINQLMASPFNDDKKLLTFSDSVQDAAHRAGFFGARTWRLNVRIAIQQALQGMKRAGQGEAPSVRELAAYVSKHWLARFDSQEDFFATFLPPTLMHWREWEKLASDRPLLAAEKAMLRQVISERLSWQVHVEYGMYARVGRTLTRAHASVASPKVAGLRAAAQAALPRLQNEVGLFHLGETALLHFLVGVVDHLQHGGAIWMAGLPEGFFLANTRGGQQYAFHSGHALPNFGPKSRLPAFVLTDSGRSDRKSQHLFEAPDRGWLLGWAKRTLIADAVLGSSDIGQMYEVVFTALIDAGLLVRRAMGDREFVGLDAGALLVELEVETMACSVCRTPRHVAAGQVSVWDGMPCQATGCAGRYVPEPEARPMASFLTMYTRGEVCRVITAEHTGLLGREVREGVEEQFKAAVAPRWYPNVLCCTPTLEMGIDIGDLSTALLCSVPPTQANYAQRVGRAGRRDGSALVVTMATGRAHDLHFFADPLGMIAGHVSTPGVYLGATAVLERQLVAFCMDQWAHHDVAPELPKTLRDVFGNMERHQGFPSTFIAYIEAHQTALVAGFLAMFPDLSDQAIATLRARIIPDAQGSSPLTIDLMEVLLGRQKELDSLKRRPQEMRNKIKKLQALPVRDEATDQEITLLDQERRAISQLVKTIRGTQTLQVLTDDGLLPNYAFPESGITLKSVISKKRVSGGSGSGGDRFEKVAYEYMRPASSGLSEFAPNNSFYAEGHRVEIERIDLKLSEPEPWRLCDACDFAMPLLGVDVEKACPSCGSPYWGEVAQRCTMLRLRQVYAWTPDRSARIGDDSDNRSFKFYTKQMLVRCEEFGEQRGWGSESYGFEYVKRAVLREINFGEAAEKGTNSQVAGKKDVRPGFKVCGKCGMVQQPPRWRSGKLESGETHDIGCSARGREDGKSLVESLYLYREIKSEAVRIMLPFLSDTGPEGDSFIAALQMGLTHEFGGNIDHLRFATTSEPLQGVTLRRQYLLLYDTIPGGTGYLRDLSRDKEVFARVLTHAKRKMVACACDDGCYRCLYAYKQSRAMQKISKKVAVELLERLGREELLPLQGPMSQMSVNPLLDSALEQRFLESLQKHGTLRKELVHGSSGYVYETQGCRWNLQLQVDLGPGDGVGIRCKPDFVFWPINQETKSQRPVAIFTDGFAYHKDRLDDDIEKRMALLASGKFWVWSLSWEDVDDVLRAKESQRDLPLAGNDPTWLKNMSKINSLIQDSNLTGSTNLLPLLRSTSHQMLRAYLQEGADSARFNKAAHLTLAAMILGPQSSPFWLGEDAAATAISPATGRTASLTTSFLGLCARAQDARQSLNTLRGLEAFIRLDTRSDQREEKAFQRAWQDALRLWNLMQFADGVAFWGARATPEMVENLPGPPSRGQDDDDAAAWQELYDQDMGYDDVLDALKHAHAPLPTPGFSILGPNGRPVGLAELAWEGHKIAVFFQDDPDAKGSAAWLTSSWQTFLIEDLQTDPTPLLTSLRASPIP